jgi:hypothetical protein
VVNLGLPLSGDISVILFAGWPGGQSDKWTCRHSFRKAFFIKFIDSKLPIEVPISVTIKSALFLDDRIQSPPNNFSFDFTLSANFEERIPWAFNFDRRNATPFSIGLMCD